MIYNRIADQALMHRVAGNGGKLQLCTPRFGLVAYEAAVVVGAEVVGAPARVGGAL